MTRTKLYLAASLLAASTVMAGWEDTGTTPHQASRPAPARPVQTRVDAAYGQPRPQTARRPRQVKSEMPATDRRSPATSAMPTDLYSSFLDASNESESWFRGTLVSSADIKGLGDGFGIFDLEAHFNTWNGRNIFSGDMTIDIDPAVKVLTDDAGLSYMPGVLLEVPVDINWTWRYINGWSFDLGFRPGIYSDVETFFDFSMFSFPISGCFYYAFSPATSFRAGMELRPGWDQVIMPLVGLAWQPSDMLRCELGLPRSLIDCQLGPIGLFGLVQWNNTTYALSGDDNGPEDITFNDWQVGGGATISFTETCRLTLELGLLTGRKVKFDGFDRDLSVKSAPYFGILLGSEF